MINGLSIVPLKSVSLVSNKGFVQVSIVYASQTKMNVCGVYGEIVVFALLYSVLT